MSELGSQTNYPFTQGRADNPLFRIIVRPRSILFREPNIHSYKVGHSSVRIATQLLTPLRLWALNLYMCGGTYSLKLTLNNRFLRSFSWQFYFTLKVFAKNLLSGNRRRNICFKFHFDVMPEV